MAHSSFTSQEDYFAAFDEHVDAVFRHCYLRTHCREKAKELTHGAFQELWDFIAAGNYVDSMKIFLFRVTHQLIEQERRKGTIPVAESVRQLAENTPNFSVLETFEPEEQSAVILHYVDGFTLNEIGAIVGGSLDTHARTLKRGGILLA